MENILRLPAAKPTSLARWGGRVLTGLAVLFLSLDGLFKVLRHPEVLKGSERLGIPESLAVTIGVILLGCVALYVVPRTAPLGAVLLTGYLGGAVFVHLRVGDPLFSHTLFPIYVGAMIWAGLFLRDERVKNLLSNPKETP